MLDRKTHTRGQELSYLRNIDVRWGTVDTSDLLKMSFKDNELERFGLKQGDVWSVRKENLVALRSGIMRRKP